MKLAPNGCLAFEDSRIGLISVKRANIETFIDPSCYDVDKTFEEASFCNEDCFSK